MNQAADACAVESYDLNVVSTVKRLKRLEGFGDFHSYLSSLLSSLPGQVIALTEHSFAAPLRVVGLLLRICASRRFRRDRRTLSYLPSRGIRRTLQVRQRALRR